MSDTRDRATAAAIQIAYQDLLRLGWKFGAADVGKYAREILKAFDAAQSSPAMENTDDH